jgi:hypothetical protein
MKEHTLEDTENYLDWMFENFADLPEDQQLEELKRTDLPLAPLRLLVIHDGAGFSID